MPRHLAKNRREDVEETARIAAEAAAAAVLERLDRDDEDEDEMEESIQPGDDGRPKTQKGRTAPKAGGPPKDVKLGSEGPDAVSKSRVQEAVHNNDDEEEDEDEMSETGGRRRRSSHESNNPLGHHLPERLDRDDEDEDDEEMREGKADDQLTRTDDSARQDSMRKRQSPTHSGDIGNEITDDSHPAVPVGTAVVEVQMAGEQPRGAAAPNPGNPEDQLTDADGDTQQDAKRAGQRGPRGSGGKPSSGALDAAQSKKEMPIDPSAVGMDKTVAETTNALFNGEDLSEEFKTKASTIIEAALKELLVRRNDQMVEAFNGFLDERVDEIREYFQNQHDQLVERVDDYLGYIVEQWISENKLAVENGLRSEISQSFMSGLHDLFREHHIELPEDRVDAFEESQDRISELENQLKEQINSNVQLRKELNVKTVDEVFAEEAAGLADTDQERLRTLSEGVEFDDADQYRVKVKILRESYFGSDRVANSNSVDEVDEINGEAPAELSDNMQAYVTTTGRLAGHPTPTSKFRQATQATQLNG